MTGIGIYSSKKVITHPRLYFWPTERLDPFNVLIRSIHLPQWLYVYWHDWLYIHHWNISHLAHYFMDDWGLHCMEIRVFTPPKKNRTAGRFNHIELHIPAPPTSKKTTHSNHIRNIDLNVFIRVCRGTTNRWQ